VNDYKLQKTNVGVGKVPDMKKALTRRQFMTGTAGTVA
jgi:hypothetical protein